MPKRNEGEVILGNMVSAVKKLEGCREFTLLIPEVRVNLVYALPRAQTPQEVAGIEGRLTAVHGFPRASGMPDWGASDHMARLIIEVRKYDAQINAGINFKCDREIIEVVREYCLEKQLSFGWIDRSQEPAEVMSRDRKSMPWKIGQLVTRYGAVPRFFYEGEGWGKEPLFVVLGKDAVEVTEIAMAIARRYKRKL